jgi:hypothetical protein
VLRELPSEVGESGRTGFAMVRDAVLVAFCFVVIGEVDELGTKKLLSPAAW